MKLNRPPSPEHQTDSGPKVTTILHRSATLNSIKNMELSWREVPLDSERVRSFLAVTLLQVKLDVMVQIQVGGKIET